MISRATSFCSKIVTHRVPQGFLSVKTSASAAILAVAGKYLGGTSSSSAALEISNKAQPIVASPGSADSILFTTNSSTFSSLPWSDSAGLSLPANPFPPIDPIFTSLNGVSAGIGMGAAIFGAIGGVVLPVAISVSYGLFLANAIREVRREESLRLHPQKMCKLADLHNKLLPITREKDQGRQHTERNSNWMRYTSFSIGLVTLGLGMYQLNKRFIKEPNEFDHLITLFVAPSKDLLDADPKSFYFAEIAPLRNDTSTGSIYHKFIYKRSQSGSSRSVYMIEAEFEPHNRTDKTPLPRRLDFRLINPEKLGDSKIDQVWSFLDRKFDERKPVDFITNYGPEDVCNRYTFFDVPTRSYGTFRCYVNRGDYSGMSWDTEGNTVNPVDTKSLSGYNIRPLDEKIRPTNPGETGFSCAPLGKPSYFYQGAEICPREESKNCVYLPQASGH